MTNKRNRNWVVAAALVGIALVSTATVMVVTEEDPVPPPPPPVQPVTSECLGFAEERIPIETQAWWFPIAPQAGLSFGHQHAKACIPTNVTPYTADTLPLTLTLLTHLEGGIPAVGTNVEIRVQEVEVRGRTSKTYRDVLVDEFKYSPAIGLCKLPNNNCVTTVPLTVDLFDSPRICQCAAYEHGFFSPGLKQVRVNAFAEVYVAGKLYARMRAGMRFPLQWNPPANSDPDWKPTVQNYTNDTEASAWFTRKPKPGAGGYSTVRYTGPVPTAMFPEGSSWVLPLAFESDPCVNNCIPDRMPTTGYDAYIDPDFHNGSEGTRILTETWAPTSNMVTRNPTISLAGIAPGRHRLVLVVRQPMRDGVDGFDVPLSDESTSFGVLVIPFVVAPSLTPSPSTVPTPTP